MHWAIREAAKVDGPVFVRVPRVPAKEVHAADTEFEFGKGLVLRPGSDVTIVAMGMMMEPALQAAELLAAEGIQAEVVECITVKPFDQELLLASAAKTGAVVTAEEHSRYGGLFSIVAETISENTPMPVLPVAIEDRFGATGTYEQLLEDCGLTAEHIAAQARKAVSMKK